MRLWTAIRAFFAVLLNAELAADVAAILRGESPAPPAAVPEKPAESPARKPPAKPARPARSEALTLLAALQREARLVDIVKEPLNQYSDEQIGSAARDVLRDCAAVFDRLFALQPVVEQEEGTPLEVPPGYDTGHYRLTGNLSGDPPFRGQLVHHGWQASRCDLPQWSGSEQSAMVVAPVELEIR